MSCATTSVKSSRSHTEIPSLIASHFHPAFDAETGWAIIRGSARTTSTVDATIPFTRTQRITTTIEAARMSPAPDGRLIIAKVRRLLAAAAAEVHPQGPRPL